MSNTELLIILIAAIVAALIKSVAGFGYPLTLIPLLAVFIDVADAVVIVAPSNFVLNLRLLWNVRDRRHKVEGLASFIPGAISGAVIGALLLPVLPGRLLRVAARCTDPDISPHAMASPRCRDQPRHSETVFSRCRRRRRSGVRRDGSRRPDRVALVPQLAIVA